MICICSDCIEKISLGTLLHLFSMKERKTVLGLKDLRFWVDHCLNGLLFSRKLSFKT